MNNKIGEERERGTGRYGYTVNRKCVCGHYLDAHAAAKTAERQECFNGEVGTGEPCDCLKFKPARHA